jgi:hypothetical protein
MGLANVAAKVGAPIASTKANGATTNRSTLLEKLEAARFKKASGIGYVATPSKGENSFLNASPKPKDNGVITSVGGLEV